MSRIAWITFSAAVLGLVALGAVVLVLAGGDDSESTRPGADTTPASTRTFALPLTDDPSALAVGDHSGNVLVGLAAKPGGPLELAALRAETPIPTSVLRIAIDGQPVGVKECGMGCSRVQAAVLDGSPRRVTVRAGSATVSFTLPARLPPSGADIFRKAQATMDGLKAFRFTERLSSGRGALTSQFDIQSPDRLRLRTESGFRSVIIGRRRWDFQGDRWQQASFPGLRVAQILMWHQAKNPRIVRRRANGVTELAAFGLQPVPAWFRLSVEPSGRVVEAEMIAASHFMRHRYSDFNGRFVITPPE